MSLASVLGLSRCRDDFPETLTRPDRESQSLDCAESAKFEVHSEQPGPSTRAGVARLPRAGLLALVAAASLVLGVAPSHAGEEDSTLAPAPSGAVKCWGYLVSRKGVPKWDRSNPPAGPFSGITTGSKHICAIDAGGAVKCWGDDARNQLKAPSGTFAQISAGSNHTCGIGPDGVVQCWGDNEYGQLEAPLGWGINDSGQATAPAGSFVRVSTSSGYSCGILK